MSVPPINANPTWGATPPAPAGALDDDYSVVEAVNEAWEAAEACQNNPSELNTEVFVQAVSKLNTALNAAITQLGPPGSGNPSSMALYNYLNEKVDPIGDTMASLCTIPPTVSMVSWLMDSDSAGPGEISGLDSLIDTNWSSTASYNQDGSDRGIRQAIQNLFTDIQAYENDPTAANALNIGLDIQELSSNLSAIKGDGYLTIFNSILTLPVSNGDTLGFLASLLKSNEQTNPPSTNLTNFMNALNTTSGNGTIASDLDYFVTTTGNEYGWLAGISEF